IECDIARLSNEEKTYGRDRDFAVDATEYAKAITYASMNDPYTVKMVSKGTSISHEINSVEIYLRHFHELESARVIVFAIKAIGFQRWMVESLEVFLEIHGCEDIIFRLRIYNDYCFLPQILRVSNLFWLVFEPTVEAIKPFLVS
ncbi:hypothetical protein FRX31_004809, partial [Thalictrum thalictroides]